MEGQVDTRLQQIRERARRVARCIVAEQNFDTVDADVWADIERELADFRKEVLREEVARLRRDQSACNSMIASHMIWMANELERLAGEQEGN